MTFGLSGRECNAGFIKNTAGTGCVPCQTGVTYRTASSNVLTEGQTNVCLPCLQCVAGRNFQTTACSPTVNRVCRACSTSCASNFFQSSPCTNSSNLGCTRCQTRCPVGQYQTLSGTCSGNTNFDAFLAACRPCLGPEDCGPGRYVSRVCPGTDRTPNQCVVCSVIPPTGDCSASQYRGGCVNFTNTRCVPFTTCARTMPMYLAGESRTKDGVCRNCTRCADLGLAVLRNCSTYDDSVCRGAACNRSAPCQTPAALANRSRLFCDYSLGEASATCGVCPSGYGSDGQFCLECPRGKTCNRLGEVECQGQCRAGAVSVCTEDLSLGGSVSCDQACGAIVPGFGARWVRRGTHVRPEPGMCDTYFQCGAGYYKIFRSTGVVECEACPTSLLPSGGQLERWVTEGLSTGDAKSCLWECRPELARLNSGRTGCALLPGRSTVTGRNPAGWWLEPLSKATGQCASGRTSEAGAAINASECIQCHALPAGAVWTAGSSQCDWGCLQQTAGAQPRKRGGACVGVVAACASLPGYSARSGACEPTGFPWNRGGYSKSAGAGTAAAVVVAVVAAAESRGGAAASSGALQDGLAMASLPYGVEGRHSLTVAGRNGSLGVQGPLCSGARVRLGRHEFILGAVCNQSFLVFLNLSRPTTRGLEVLIGNSTPGWRDGFKTQALFESELYVAPSAWSNETLFVLDRWNCLLREVVLYGEPGGYLTRAYTVWGRTEKLASLVPEPRCYGAGGLAAPRRFWALRDGWVAFADDNGLWQFHTRTRDLVLMLRESDGGFEADELVDVDTTDEFTLRLVFADAVWLVSAEAQACPTDSTSMPGGDCTVDCAWLSSTLVPVRFVNRTGDGACVPCTQRECGYGEAFAACTRAEDGGCRPCEPRPEAGVYTDRGTCEDSAWRVGLPPCSAGSYATDGGRYCEPCPTLTATWRAGATDARQCKCLPGLVRRGDRCVAADGLYEFEVPCAAREACSIPPFARLHPGDLVGCRFECLPGYYHRVGAGWLDKCSPCLAAEGNASSSSSTVFVTRGDDDEPWSCEWGPY